MFNEGVNADGVPLGLRAGNVLSNIIAKNVMGQEIGNAYSGRVFDEREFNFSQQLYLEAMIRVAKDNDIELEGGGLESWLVNHNKDVVLTDPDDATISISAAHLLQLIIDEYTNPDGMQMNASDQQLFRDYWRLNGDVWIEKTSSKKAPAKAAKLMPESDEVTDDEVAVNMVKEVLSAGVETVKIGKEPGNKEFLQFTIPKNSWFAAHPLTSGSYSLLGCTVSPGFDFDDFELGKMEVLSKAFPQHQKLIRKFTLI